VEEKKLLNVDQIQVVKQEMLELFNFVDMAMKDFASIHKPALQEGTVKTVETTQQLMRVSEETEQVATEMLNLIDAMNERLDAENQIMAQLSDNFSGIEKELLPEYAAIVEKMEAQGMSSEAIIEMKKQLARLIEHSRTNLSYGVQLREHLDMDTNDMFELMNRMQFQDITAQQIAAAVNNIKSIYDRITHVLGALNIAIPDENSVITIAMPDTGSASYDGNATVGNREERQQMADEISRQQEEISG